jgi:hypothetical protein
MNWQTTLQRIGHLGWIPPHLRTEDQHAAHAVAMKRMLPFPLLSDPPPVGTKVMLTDLWRHPQVVKALGKPYTGSHQETGSCVNSGAQNAVMTLMCRNVILSGLQENLLVPFTLLAYGKSRQLAGMRGRGEGSLGSTMAQAVHQFGVLDASTSGLPPFTVDDGFDWGQQAELTWSDGASISQNWLSAAAAHLVGPPAQIKTTDELRSAILNGYPVTRAHIHWCNPGSETAQGDYVIGTYNGSGGHQMSHQGYANDSQLGELFYESNNWGEHVYKTDPSTGLGSGYWVAAATVQKAMDDQDAEFFVYSGPLGFTRTDPTWRTM